MAIPKLGSLVDPLTRRHVLGILPTLSMGAAFVAQAAPVEASDVEAAAGTAPPPSTADNIARFVVEARFEDLPAGVVAKAKEHIAYHLGLAFAGASSEEATQLRLLLRDNGAGSGAAVIGERSRLPISDAIFANTTLMRAAWLDDVVWPSGVHAGICTLPPALGFGELRARSGRDLILAMVLGYEVMGKLGDVADPWTTRQPRRPTTLYGPFGTITVAGRMLGLDQQRMAAALGYAANSGMGVPEGGQTQHYYSLLTRNAAFAALVAEAGGTPYEPTTIEGEGGLYRSFFGEVPASLPRQVEALGTGWEMLKAVQKRYPGTGQNSVPTEVLKRLVKQRRISPADVDRIDVVLGSIADSATRKKEISDLGPFRRWEDAWSSLPFSLALVILDGDVHPRRYMDAQSRSDPQIASLMRRIRLSWEDGHTTRYARLSIALRSGEVLAEAAEDVSFTLLPEAWLDWLRRDGDQLLGTTRVKKLNHMLQHLEEVRLVSELTHLLVPPQGKRG